MEMVQQMMGRVRSIVGPESWDYCVLWKLSKDQRLIEWVDCCCSGAQIGCGGDDEELLFPASSNINLIRCRDVIFHHPRTKSCDILDQLPSSMPFDLDSSSIYAKSLMSNQPKWFNFSNISTLSDISHEENIGTKVLIPVSVGLIELFVSKQVSEDQGIVDSIVTLFNMSVKQPQPTDNTIGEEVHVQNTSDHFHPAVSPATMLEHLNLSSADMSSSPMNFLQQFNYTDNDNKINTNVFLDKPLMIHPFDPSADENGFEQDHQVDALQRQMLGHEEINMKVNLIDPLETGTQRQGNDKVDSSMNPNSDSVSDCSDPNDEDDDPKCRRRGGKGQSKNLLAERRRRKKLNDRLYTLRSLVPKITKLDRASILKDAIEYVQELQNQARDLQNELEENSDNEGGANNQSTIVEQEVLHANGMNIGRRLGHVMFPNGTQIELPQGRHGSNNVNEPSKQNHVDHDVNTKDKEQQMEPQVEVSQLDGNEFFVKVFCEQKRGGFVKLMEAFTSLGLEVTNVNITSFRCLVLNVFKVERKNGEAIQADSLRESLLEITRNPSRGTWPEITAMKASENGSGAMDHHHHNQHQQRHQYSQLHHHHHMKSQLFDNIYQL